MAVPFWKKEKAVQLSSAVSSGIRNAARGWS